MKTVLFSILLALSMSVFAQDSGLYFTPQRDGEGINLIRNKDRVVFYFYTYETEQTCWNIEVPTDQGLVTEENCAEQRWFFGAGDELVDESTLEGWLYMGLGINYPDCIPNPNDPFLLVCGEAHIVGRYIMERSNDGWKMVVIHFGEILDKEDVLFTRVWDFAIPLFPATD